jgi:CheY-like chemotaxis protein
VETTERHRRPAIGFTSLLPHRIYQQKAARLIVRGLIGEPLHAPPTVLIVEDEPLVGQVLHALLSDHGYRPLGPIPTLVAAREAIAEHRLSAALLDIRLGGDDRCFEIAEILSALRIPFAFLSSYSAALVPHKYRDVPYLPKPYGTVDVLAVLARLLGDGPAEAS